MPIAYDEFGHLTYNGQIIKGTEYEKRLLEILNKHWKSVVYNVTKHECLLDRESFHLKENIGTYTIMKELRKDANVSKIKLVFVTKGDNDWDYHCTAVGPQKRQCKTDDIEFIVEEFKANTVNGINLIDIGYKVL